MTCEFAHLDGAYVLGALSPTDRLAFERHLPMCSDCTRAVQELAGMPGLLARVSPEILTSASAAEPVPETLLPDLVRRARAAQRRRTRKIVAVAAAAVLVVSAGAVTAAVLLDEDPQPTAQSTSSEPPQQMTPLIDIPISASVSLTSVDWDIEGIVHSAVRVMIGAIEGKPRRRRIVCEPSLMQRQSTGRAPDHDTTRP